jgi:invasion protein IalB
MTFVRSHGRRLTGAVAVPGRPPALSLCTALAVALTFAGVGAVAPALAGGVNGTPPTVASPTALSPSPGADGTVKAQHGDWQVVCKPPPVGAKSEVCALVQSVTAEDRNNVGLTIYFQKFSNGTKVLRVFAPLGILLPPGIGLKVDGVDIGHAPFLRCHTIACYAQVTVDDKLVGQLQTGKTAIFIIFQTEEAGIGIPISLNGFKEGVAALN